MTSLISQKIKISFLLAIMSSFVACGGGNSDTKTTADNGAYKGKTTQVKLTSSSNFISFIADANKSKKFIPASNVSGNLQQLTASKFNFSTNANALLLPDSLVEGPCLISGNKREKFSQSQETTEITIETTFDNCIEIAGVYEDGYQLITSLNDTVNPQNSRFSNTTKNYTYRDNMEHTITNGTLFVSGSDTTTTGQTIEMDIVIEDKLINETTKLEDVYITIKSELNQNIFTFSGKIYNSNDGYITIETPKPIITINGDMYPSSGVMRIIAASETENMNAIIEITYQPGDTYTIKVDLDGDGVFEINQSCNWSQMCNFAI